MYQFCFNDCIPNTANEHSLTQCLVDTLKEYNEVKKEYPENIIPTGWNQVTVNTQSPKLA